MNFKLFSYFPVVLAIFCLIVVVIYLYERSYFKWIYRHWFYKKSASNFFRNLFYFTSIALFLLSALDLRGPSQKIDSKIPDQKTVVIIDASASMLAEDIKPNRFEKAILIARHFVSKAYGHQISVVVFSDIKRKIVPFTDDVNILDARIDALRDLDIRRGSSNIGIALMEAVQDIKAEAGESGEASGNVLLLTDSEGSDKDVDITVPKGINLAVVGVGTRAGSNIPIRDKEDRLTGFKQSKGEKVISKLDEDYIKKIGSKAKNFKYWVTSSYNMPTEEILSFFKQSFVNNLKSGSLNIEPVLTYRLIIAAIIFFCLSVFCSLFSTFKIDKNIQALFLFGIISSLWNQDVLAQQQNNENKKTNPKIESSLDKISSGNFNDDEKIKLAKEYLDLKQYDKSNILYDEYIKNQKNPNAKIVFNYATSKIANGEIKEGLELYKQIEKSDDVDKEKMRKNISLALAKKKQQEKQKEKKQKQDQKEDKQDKKNPSSGGDNSEKDDKKRKGNEDQKDSSNGQNKENKKENKDKENDKNKSEKDKQDKQESNDKSNQEKSLEEKLKEKEKSDQDGRKDMKLHGMIKQLLNEDKDLQRQYMDPRIDDKNNKKNNGEDQDW